MCLSRCHPTPEHHSKFGRSHLVGRNLPGDAPALYDDQSAGELEDFVEINRDDDHRRSSCCSEAELLMNSGCRCEVQAARRVAAQHYLGISRQFACKNELLMIAT